MSVQPEIAIIGGGPAGLMAAEVLSASGRVSVTVYDRMPSVGRKFLMAGKGGMNITHAEPYPAFVGRYHASSAWQKVLDTFPPAAIRDWIHGLGIDTFVGTSGRVFPDGMKAAPLLRAWLHRLRLGGVRLAMRHRWTGWEDGQLVFETPDGRTRIRADATLLALGGGSWAKLGSDGTWTDTLAAAGIAVRPLTPANCGFDVAWSAHFRSRHAGEAVKTVTAHHAGQLTRGEFVITGHGVEGGLIYALSSSLNRQLGETGRATFEIDLLPGRETARLVSGLSRPRGRQSLSSHVRRQTGLTGVKASLLRECAPSEAWQDMTQLASFIKALPLTVERPRPLDEAISSAGGVNLEALTPDLMHPAHPGLFLAGEMLDWDAPTGGYLLTGCLASGRHAAEGILRWLAR